VENQKAEEKKKGKNLHPLRETIGGKGFYAWLEISQRWTPPFFALTRNDPKRLFVSMCSSVSRTRRSASAQFLSKLWALEALGKQAKQAANSFCTVCWTVFFFLFCKRVAVTS
jgi:hypothetical protein